MGLNPPFAFGDTLWSELYGFLLGHIGRLEKTAAVGSHQLKQTRPCARIPKGLGDPGARCGVFGANSAN